MHRCWSASAGMLLAGLTLSAGQPAHAQTSATDEEICARLDAKPALRIAACGRLIKAARDKRELSDLYNNRGTALSAAGEKSRALADYTQAIRLDAASAVPYTNRGDLHLFSGDLDAALSDFNAALKLKPDFERAHMGRTVSLLRKGDRQDALQAADDMVRNLPSSAIAVETKAYVLKAIGSREEAITVYRKALKMAADVPQLRDEIERALKSLGATSQ